MNKENTPSIGDRRNGKTTRLIDEAIQHLFKTGSIRFLSNKEIYGPSKAWFHSKDKDVLLRFIDPDASESNEAQYNFVARFSMRVICEHESSVIIKDIYNYKVKNNQ